MTAANSPQAQHQLEFAQALIAHRQQDPTGWMARAALGSIAALDPTEFKLRLDSLGRSAAAGFFAGMISGLQVSLDAARGVTLVGGDVSAWADQSASALSFAQAVAGQRPLFVAADATYNSQPVVSSTAANSDVLIATAGLIIANPALTILAVGENDTANSYLVSSDDAANNGPALRRTAAAVTLEINSGATLIAAATDCSVPCFMLGEFNNLASIAAVNTVIGGTAGAAGTNDTAGFALFADRAGAAGFSTSKLAELAVYNRVLTASEKALWAGYVRARYGITVAV
jgi:hypothetical protein